MKKMLPAISVAIAAASLLLQMLGCTGAVNSAKNARNTAIGIAYGGYMGWTNYYVLSTNQANITPERRAALDNAERMVKSDRLHFSATVGVADSLIAAYETNSAVEPQLTAVLNSLGGEASNILWLINYYQTQ